MADNTKFKFNWNVGEMAKDAEKIGREQGLRGRNDLDSFRHGYTTAKTADEFDSARARIFGMVNELRGSAYGYDTIEDTYVDLRNNEIGLQILEEVEQEVARRKAAEGLSEEQTSQLKDELLRTRVANAVRAGQMGQRPFRDVDRESDADRLLIHPYKRNK